MSDTRTDDATRDLQEAVGDQTAFTGPDMVAEQSCPTYIGRYRVEKILGRGGFGTVYLATDEELHRSVAVKVPHSRLLQTPESLLRYLSEPRMVANLDHPNIVPVYDVGSSEQAACYFVAKFITGATLQTRFQDYLRQWDRIAELVATLAEALHYAHKRGVIHRDIKPGNILIDEEERPYLADFGLALREADLGTGARYVGTPAYMSPEQARGEGHRVDGRSDIYSLGAVLYELLTGRQTFHADSEKQLLEQIATLDVKPARQVDDSIPRELERICLKALAKRASERYTTALDLADDLRHFRSGRQELAVPDVAVQDPTAPRTAIQGAPSVRRPSDDSLQVVPRGLRCFDGEDAAFFLDLLPGPRDRQGLPESVRFWKRRIEQTDPEKTFCVGLIYGPSGCGKSSLVRAGILPRLSPDVRSVFVEATPHDTERSLLRGLQRRFSEIPPNETLPDALRRMRQQGSAKVVLVIDQFEQWLHTHRAHDDSELVTALRQCDGSKLQALVLVRDDFSMAAARFMAALDIPIAQGVNFATVDLFDVKHAITVLTKLGKAFGALPRRSEDLTPEQREFVEATCHGLAEDGRVVSVRLALFAEMVKTKRWEPATLREVGGTDGVGVRFLEETLGSRSANPAYLLHERAARAVLKRLLPSVGTDIRGNMRSRAELLAASGYEQDLKSFDDLMRILDGELRVVTPTDPQQEDSDDEAIHEYYQLTHDYLVPSLRRWLNHKQRESRRGRAELKLQEIQSIWSSTRQRRHLPGLFNWARVLLFTDRFDWSPEQREMMRLASWRFLFLTTLLVVSSGATAWIIRDYRTTARAEAIVGKLGTAHISQLPAILQDLQSQSESAAPYLAAMLREPENSRARLHASLATLADDPRQLAYVMERYFEVELESLPVITDLLDSHRGELVDTMWGQLNDPKSDEQQRLRAAYALARFDPPTGTSRSEPGTSRSEPGASRSEPVGEQSAGSADARWSTVTDQLTEDLLTRLIRAPSEYALLAAGLRPIRLALRDSLQTAFADADPRRSTLAGNLLLEYFQEDVEALATLIPDADRERFPPLMSAVEHDPEAARAMLVPLLDESLHSMEQGGSLIDAAQRASRVGTALLRLGEESRVWPLLRDTGDRTLQTFLIHDLARLDAPAPRLFEQLQQENRADVAQAILQSLGSFSLDRLPPELLPPMVAEGRRRLADTHPGVRASAEWMLRQWGQLPNRDELPASPTDEDVRDETEGHLAQHWYRNPHDHLMVVVDGRTLPEIGYRYAVSDRETTVDQLKKSRPTYEPMRDNAPTDDCPANVVAWFEAAAYCNWLTVASGLGEDAQCYFVDPQTGKLTDHPDLTRRRGFRLPTSAEWEYACNAGASTTYHFGHQLSHLSEYAWYAANSDFRLWPVGSKKPNSIGIFDLHGNAMEWINDQKDAGQRFLRGGYAKHGPDGVETSSEDAYTIDTRFYSVGFRVVRTLATDQELP